jgi:phospholipid-binding lipoprotein MlaA
VTLRNALAVCAFFLLTAGCSSTHKKHHPDDPFEGFNRASYEFNVKLDKWILKPISVGYDKITPAPVRKGVLNAFSNMGEVPTFANDVLQLHPVYALSDFWRFFINSTVGVGGLFDVASKLKLERRYNDFGITLAHYGVKHSSYLVIPFIGPSTFRDGIGLLVNVRYLTLWPYIEPNSVRNGLFAFDVVSLRASLLDSEDIMDQAAIDPYVFIRNAYLQRRKSLIANNGNASESAASTTTGSTQYDDLDYALGGEE